MVKILLTLIFVLIGLGQTKAQLRMPEAQAREAMRTLAYTVEAKTIKKGKFVFVHYWNTKLNQETILRINPAGTCDQLITVMPMENWVKYVKIFNGENPAASPAAELLWQPAGKDMWIKADGTVTCSLIPDKDKQHFSMVMATIDTRP